ncbi:MAG: hypothetical protein ABW076_04730 [Candidatus Thiodiazotropha sp.]
MLDADLAYAEMRGQVERALEVDLVIFQEYHALIVNPAKTICRKVPVCGDCGLLAERDYAATT